MTTYTVEKHDLEARLAAAERRARVAERALELTGMAECPVEHSCLCPDITCTRCLLALSYAIANEEEADNE